MLASPLAVALLEPDERLKTGLDVMARSAELLINEVYRDDLATAIAVNRSVLAYTTLARELSARCPAELDAILAAAEFPYMPPAYDYFDIRVVVPEVAYSDALEFDPARIRAAIAAGREVTKRPWTQVALERILRPDGGPFLATDGGVSAGA